MAGSDDIDLATVLKDSKGVSIINEGERLSFARHLLLGLAMICTGVFVAHGMYPDNSGVSQIFELVKIGALPLVTLVVSFYFPNSSTK